MQKDIPVIYTIWQEAWLAISKPSFYVRWALQKFNRSLQFFVYIHIVLALVFTVYFAVAIRPELKAITQDLVKDFPETTIVEGALSVADDETLTYTDSDQVYIKIDPTTDLSNAHIDQFYQVGFLAAEDGILFKDSSDVMQFSYDELGIENLVLSESIIINFVDQFIRVSYILLPVLMFIWFFITKLVYTVFFSFLFVLFSLFKVRFVDIWSMALYALVPATLADILLFFVLPEQYSGFTIVFLVYMSIAMFYLRRFELLKNQLPKN